MLVDDDDPQTLRHVRDALAAAGYKPLTTGDPAEVPRIVRTAKPRLVVLDSMLPRTDGIEPMDTVPELGDVPVVFISGYGRDETVAKALECGAADYIVKPFSPTELIARVRAALRGRESEPFVLGELAIDYGRRRAALRGEPVALTATEFDLLRLLSLNVDRVTTYDTILRHVRTFVKKLRRKLGDDAANPAYLVNERGVQRGGRALRWLGKYPNPPIGVAVEDTLHCFHERHRAAIVTPRGLHERQRSAALEHVEARCACTVNGGGGAQGRLARTVRQCSAMKTHMPVGSIAGSPAGERPVASRLPRRLRRSSETDSARKHAMVAFLSDRRRGRLVGSGRH